MERKAFLTNPKHQDRVSEHGEYDCGAYNKMNEDYYEHSGLSYFTDKC